jgi:glyoxylase-like metal-dependent hydrolase (beta-lactamase superfamily II)
MKKRSGEHLEGLKVLKERLDGTVPTLPTRFVADQDTRLELGGTVLELKYRKGGHTPADMVVWLPQKSVLGLHPVSNTRNWLESFAVIDALKPQTIVPGHGNVTNLATVPGHGNVTNLATAQAHTRDLLLALRAHMKKAVDDGVDLSAAVKTFDGKPFSNLKHADVWIPQLANQTYLEMERE